MCPLSYPADPVSAFVPLGRVDLGQTLCVEHERVVGRDNAVTADHVALQLERSQEAENDDLRPRVALLGQELEHARAKIPPSTIRTS